MVSSTSNAREVEAAESSPQVKEETALLLTVQILSTAHVVTAPGWCLPCTLPPPFCATLSGISTRQQ